MRRVGSILFDDAPPTPEQRPNLASWYTPGLSDGLGDRLLMFDNSSASSLELLRFKREFSRLPAFEAALRRRIKQLERFSHPSVAKVRAVQWLGDGEGLALISNHTVGQRLSELLTRGQGQNLAMELVRQLTPVLAALQEHGDGLAHGALTPDRIVVTPEGRLVLVEHVIGSALESLQLPANRLQSELGLVVPQGAATIVFDARTDVVQLAFVALSVLLGRQVDPRDYPEKVAELLDDLAPASANGALEAPHLRPWLERALQLGGRAFDSAKDAGAALNELPQDRPTATLEKRRSMVAVPAQPEPPAAAGPVSELAFPSELDFPSEKEVSVVQVEPPPRVWSPAITRPAVDDRAARGTPTRFAYHPARPIVDLGPPSEAALDARAQPARAQPRKPRSALKEGRPWWPVYVTPWATAALAVLAFAEALIIASLLYTRPPAGTSASVEANQPSVAESTSTSPPRPAPTGAVPFAARTKAEAKPAGQPAPAQPPPTTRVNSSPSIGTQALNAAKSAGSAVGQVAAAAWRGAVWVVDAVFTRVSANFQQ